MRGARLEPGADSELVRLRTWREAAWELGPADVPLPELRRGAKVVAARVRGGWSR